MKKRLQLPDFKQTNFNGGEWARKGLVFIPQPLENNFTSARLITAPEDLPADGPADTPEDEQPYPVGCHIFGTAIAIDVSDHTKLVVNRDMLPGGVDRSGQKYFWGIRITIAGHNGYDHYEWVGFQSPGGTACSSWGGVPQNSTMTWVRVASIEEAIANGADFYGPSR